LRAIESTAGSSLAQAAAGIADAVRALGPALALPLFDLATPALKNLPATERLRWLEGLRAAIAADGRMSLRELALLTIARKRLSEQADRVEPTGTKAIADLRDDVLLLLSLLAHAGTHDARWSALAFERGALAVKLEGRTDPLARTAVGLDRVTPALLRLRTLAPAAKARLLEGCVLTVTADDRLALAEAELIRMIASELDCPLPPILAAGVHGGA